MSIAEAVRAELRKILDEKEFDIVACTKVVRLATAAKAMLQAAGGIPEHVQLLEEQQASMMSYQSGLTVNSPLTALAPSSAAETFGARAIQEFLKVLPALIPKPSAPKAATEDPVKLLAAITAAKAAGMTEIAAKLERRLLREEDPPTLIGTFTPEAAPIEVESMTANGRGPLPTDPRGYINPDIGALADAAESFSGPALAFTMPGVVPPSVAAGPVQFGED